MSNKYAKDFTISDSRQLQSSHVIILFLPSVISKKVRNIIRTFA